MYCVFFNNKTYFRVEGLNLGSSFAMNAWIKSHDTGYATLFSVNGDCSYRDSTVSEFSWRLANGKQYNRKRRNMIGLTDWSNGDSSALLEAYDAAYKPCQWNNLAFSVSYDWESCLSTITIYSMEMNCFYIRA